MQHTYKKEYLKHFVPIYGIVREVTFATSFLPFFSAIVIALIYLFYDRLLLIYNFKINEYTSGFHETRSY